MRLLIISCLFCFITVQLVASAEQHEIVKFTRIFYYSSYFVETLVRSNTVLPDYKPNAELKIYVHGYKAGKDQSLWLDIKYAYSAKGDVNLMIVDWSEAGAELLYPVSRYLVPKIGYRAGYMLSQIMKHNNIEPEQVHLIGHSLGAHVAGNIGRYFNGTLGRITLLDPALPLFTKDASDSARKSDAMFIDTIHTSGGSLGEVNPRGHVNFYPNYGIEQPGCEPDDDILLNSCSHYRAVQYFRESILDPNAFPTHKCIELEDIILRRGSNCKHTDPMVYMGEHVNKSATGIYFLETFETHPYSTHTIRLLTSNNTESIK